MSLNVTLLDNTITKAQWAILALWGATLLGVVSLWLFGSLRLFGQDTASTLLSVGRLLGLLATFFALTQFMLMGRVSWIERSFGLDRLASYHRLNGYLAITFIVLHPFFIVSSYAVASGQNFVAQYVQTLQDYPYTWLALIAEILFVTVVISSIYIARKHLKFETWYFIHLMVYAAIVIVPFHQFVASPELAGSTVGRVFWLALYGFVALNILIWRFGLLLYNAEKFRFVVSRVERETPTTTSVYIKARGLSRLSYKPGQFVMVRILSRKLWWQEHPFTVSWIPHGGELRLTIRNVGDYTTDIESLKPGARLLVAGPFGRFTDVVAKTDRRLFIAGGVGITPLRALAEQAVAERIDSVLLYANRDRSDVPLKSELDTLATSNYLKVGYIYSDEKAKTGISRGRIDGDFIKKHAPDLKKRDVYVCGPQPMMAAVVRDLMALGVPPEQIHFEQFSLHRS